MLDDTMRMHVARGTTATAGLVLFVCLFLPAVMTCDRVDYPYRYPPLYPLYLFGLFSAALALARWPAHRTVKVLWTVFIAIIGAGLGVIAVRILWDFTQDRPPSRRSATFAGLIFVSLWAVASLGWIGFWRRGRPPLGPLRRGRLLQGMGALYCLTFFTPFLVDDKPLYGMYVSAAVATVLILAALLIPVAADPGAIGTGDIDSARDPP
jgi:hypothetical protein